MSLAGIALDFWLGLLMEMSIALSSLVCLLIRCDPSIVFEKVLVTLVLS